MHCTQERSHFTRLPQTSTEKCERSLYTASPLSQCSNAFLGATLGLVLDGPLFGRNGVFNAPAEPRKSDPCSCWAAAGNVHGAGVQAAVGGGVQSLALLQTLALSSRGNFDFEVEKLLNSNQTKNFTLEHCQL